MGDSGLNVRVEAQDELVVWDVMSCPVEPDWVGTTIEFARTADPIGGVGLAFTHRGLAPLPRAEVCFAGWGHYLPSLVSYVESGVGNPGPRRH